MTVLVTVPLGDRELGWGYADRVWFSDKFRQAAREADVEVMLARDLFQPVVGTDSEYLHIKFAHFYGERSFPIVERLFISYTDEEGVERKLFPRVADRDHGSGHHAISWVFSTKDLHRAGGRFNKFVVDFGDELCFVPVSKRMPRPSKFKLLIVGFVAAVVSLLFTERVKKRSGKGKSRQNVRTVKDE